MKNKIRILLMFLGLGLILYPIISNMIYKNTQTTVVTNYRADILNKNKEDIQEIKDNYKQHNQEIYRNSVSNVNLLKEGETIGYIEIEKINIKLAIYEGTGDNVLMKGIGHLKNTSLPEGKNTHSVFAGHSGLSSAKIFDNLDKLIIGDNFKVTILDDTYLYEVDQIKTVEKNNVEDLKIEKGKEYVTLVTCTPKYINSHRLLVRGKRIKEDEKIEVIETKTVTKKNKEIIYINIQPLCMIIIIFVSIFITFEKVKKSCYTRKKELKE